MSTAVAPPDPKALSAVLEGSLAGEVYRALGQLELAEEEIGLAQRRHPAHWDLIWHSFKLTQPTRDLMETPFVFRGHLRELFARVAAGQDTRPGTWAEIALVCRDASLVAPLNTAAAGLYTRAWNRAFAGLVEWEMPHLAHYEALEMSAIGDMEQEARAKTAQPWRSLDPAAVTCRGQHNGRDAPCRYASAPGR